MAGHSKWANIKHRKDRADKKDWHLVIQRMNLFGKLPEKQV